MDYSFAFRSTLRCTYCGQIFTTDLWRIIDVEARPDLAARAREGTIHHLICPDGHINEHDDGLLFYQPNEDPPLVFSPARYTTAREDGEQAVELLRILRDSLGDAWQEEWMPPGAPGGVEVVMRDSLAEALGASLRDPPLVDDWKASDPSARTEEALFPTITTFIDAPDWWTSYYFLIDHRELLSDEADALLARFIEEAVATGNEAQTNMLNQHRALLLRAREVGAEAFAEKMGMTADQFWSAKSARELLGMLSPETRQDFMSLIDELRGAGVASPSELMEIIADRPELGSRVETAFRELVGDDEDVSDWMTELSDESGGDEGSPIRFYTPDNDPEDESSDSDDEPPDTNYPFNRNWGTSEEEPPEVYASEEQIASILAEFLEADNWPAAYIVLQAQPVLLTAQTDALLTARLSQAEADDDAALVAILQEHQTLLRRSREVGAAPAFAEKLHIKAEEMGLAAMSTFPPLGAIHLMAGAQSIGNLTQEAIASGNDTLLTEIASQWEQILRDSAFERSGLPFQLATLNNASGAYRRRYMAFNNAADLDRAIELCRNALRRALPSFPSRLVSLNNLGVALQDRYQQTGEIEDLTEAIQCLEDVTVLAKIGTEVWTGAHSNLGSLLNSRYARFGKPDYLLAALDKYETSLRFTPVESADRAVRLNNLGGALHDRYLATSSVEDLERCLIMLQEAVALASNRSDEAMCRSSLGTALRSYYARFRSLETLNKAIKQLERAVALVPQEALNRPGYANNLANALRDRYAATDSVEDLERGIHFWSEAVRLAGTQSPALAMYLNNLGNGLNDRYYRSGRGVDLDKAIEFWREAVAHPASDQADRANHLNSLGTGLGDRFVARQAVGDADPADLDEALRCCRDACQLTLGVNHEVALRAARAWARLALRQGQWAEAIAAAGRGQDALRAADAANLFAGERLSWRGVVQGLAGTEAYAHARLGDPTTAVLTLETGHAGQLNAVLGRGRDRALLARLRKDDASLLAAYEVAAEEAQLVQRAAVRTESRRDGRELARADVSSLRERAVAAQDALDGVLTRIHARPGYETFLAPTAFDDVTAGVAYDQPLAYLAASPAGSIILLVRAGQATPDVLWADLTSDELDRLLVRRAVAAGNVGAVQGGLLPAQVTGVGLGQELAAALPVLGARLIAPLAARLRELGTTSIMLIPGGRLNLLPLHAATYMEDGVARTFLDEFVIAFAPSAQTVVQSRERTRSAGDNKQEALVIGNPLPLPVGVRSLDSALEESKAVASLLHVSALVETAATLPAVASALPGKRVLHFAGHGIFDSHAPLNSGLVLAGGQRLTLRAIRDEAALDRAHLAVLSACQTALTDFQDLPDEVIGLPAGFLAAGVASVVGSLWPVNDPSTATLMIDFHRRVLAGMPPTEALTVAQRWLRDVTWGELDTYYTTLLQDVPAVEVAQAQAAGHDPSEVPYSDPYHWAAFAFYGA